MLQRGCKLYVSCSFCCSPCSQPVHLAIWKIHEKKRIAICALVLKVWIIQPLRFNGYSSWLTNNLLCLHYFVYVFPYEKQRIEKKDQRFQKQLCFESQNALFPSNNRDGFYAQASVSHCTLARLLQKMTAPQGVFQLLVPPPHPLLLHRHGAQQSLRFSPLASLPGKPSAQWK